MGKAYRAAVCSVRVLLWAGCLALLLAGCEGNLDTVAPDDARPMVMLMDSGPGDRDAGPGGDDAGEGMDSGTMPMDSGPGDLCAGVTCGMNASCNPATGTCACDSGFVDMGAGCVRIPTGDPAGRTMAEVCDMWRSGHVERASPPWTPGGMCAPGTLSPLAIEDTIRRIDMYRWLVGLNGVTGDESQHPGDQACAVMMDAAGSLSHSPGPGWPCYTAEGAAAAGRSNLALGVSSPGQAIDLYMSDRGVDSLGHRRWVINFRLGRVGIGFAGRAQCLGVFDMSGSTSRTWVAYPNPGPTPSAITGDVWSFHMAGAGSADVTVESLSGGPLGVSIVRLPGGFGADAVGWVPSGWTPSPGQTYRVTISGVPGGPIVYQVQVVSC